MGSILSYDPNLKLKRDSVSLTEISQINENTMLLVNGDIYRFCPDIKTECFRILTASKNGECEAVFYHHSKVIHIMLSVSSYRRIIEGHHSTASIRSFYDGEYFLKEKEI